MTRVQGLTHLAVTSLASCLDRQEAAAVSCTKSAITFSLSSRQAIALVLRAQARRTDRGSAAYNSLDAIVSKLRNPDVPRRPDPPLSMPAIARELDRLETQVATLLNHRDPSQADPQ